ncbi:MAG: hypothetical protein COW29_00365 [Rhodobacterales bacterium CG15_BIG_FIL_POST_REV_8_21_14_020_59_13]|nr:MAG: hypothetical protein COW29_00365 [Rhodobacterales bacterium CG15_BIG_FIL_POST_REV_8_21_14_020_59_13]
MFKALFFVFAVLAVPASAEAQTYRADAVQFSMLPSSRSVGIGETATVFGTALSTVPQSDCELVLGEGAPGATLSWRLLDENNQITNDNQNAHFPLTGASSANPGGVPQNLLVAITSPAALNNADVDIFTRCANTAPNPAFDYYRNPLFPGVNTLLLNVSAVPVPDILVIGQSLTADGYVRIPAAGARRPAAIAAVNIGAAGSVTVSANTGNFSLPVSINLCETDSNGICTSARAETLEVNFGTNQVRTFNVFVQSDGEHGVADLPGLARVYFEFGIPAPASDIANAVSLDTDSAAQLSTRYGATSFAVIAAAPVTSGDAIAGVYRGLIFGGNGGPFGSFPATIVVFQGGTFAITERGTAGWAATAQGAILPLNQNTGGRALSQSAMAYAEGVSATRTASNAVNRQGGNIFPLAGINAQVTNLFNSPYTFTYQAVYDPVAEQTLSGNLTAESSAIVGQTFDIFYNGNDIGDLDTGTEVNGGGVGSATVTWPGQSSECTVSMTNLRLNEDRTTWQFVSTANVDCGVPSFDFFGFVDDTQGSRRIELAAYIRGDNAGSLDTFPIVLVAK